MQCDAETGLFHRLDAVFHLPPIRPWWCLFCHSLISALPLPPLSSPSLSFHQQTFVSMLSSEITYERLASVHVSLSLPACLSVSLSQPATGMHLEERLARRTGSNKFKAALEPGCLSLSPSFSLYFLTPTPPAPAPCFPSVPPPLQVSLFSSLLFLQTLLPFAALFPPLLPPLLLFSRLSPLFLWHERDTKRSFECLCV